MKQIHRTKSLLAFLTAGTFGAAAVNAATILSENFNASTTASPPSGWNLNASPGTSTTTITSVDIGQTGGVSNVLQIATGSFYQIAETPTLNLTGATLATIAFDYGDTNGGGTRFISVDFFNGTTWVNVSGNISHNTNNGPLSYNVTTGFGANNKFRFEGKNAGGGGQQNTYIDNVLITADVIPEPSATLLGGLGFLMLLRRRSR
jgi:hypothetical protein